MGYWVTIWVLVVVDKRFWVVAMVMCRHGYGELFVLLLVDLFLHSNPKP